MDAVSICRERNFQKERVREDGWQEASGAIHKQQQGWKKVRSKRKKSKKERQADGGRQKKRKQLIQERMRRTKIG